MSRHKDDAPSVATYADYEVITPPHELRKAGVGEQDGVAIMCRNHRGFIDTTIACSKLGASALYLNTAFAGPQIADEETPDVSWRREPIPGLSPETLARIRVALAKSVADPAGTGYKTVRSQLISIAGKTGTAQTGGGKPDHAWFAGYAPAEAPRVAFAVVLERAGSGGKAAGPIARQLVEAFVTAGVLDGSRATVSNTALK